MKKDMIKQRNKMFSSILKELTSEIANEALKDEAQSQISYEQQ